jgi:asparagine synthase (glutamine-hydrolysing)
MCGIAGLLAFPELHQETSKGTLTRMLAALHHRGPDAQGIALEGPVALGHRRLAIVDLTESGQQPMTSPSGRYLMVFNGEIYNHKVLRQALEREGSQFRGHSDTEVLLALIEQTDLLSALKCCEGMFAIALWDRQSQTLQLARDRLGEKPLYWGQWGRQWVFGSELKALRSHPEFPAAHDPVAVTNLLQYGYVAAPRTIHAGVAQVRPGTIVTLQCNAPVSEHRWWSPEMALAAGQAEPWTGSFDEASAALEALLIQAVGDQMQADVPLGAFLSGGVDSSLVVALMQQQARRPVRSFAIGFEEPGSNEAPHAAAVARHLGTEHTELTVTSRDALDVIPALPTLYDEPLGDSSQIPTYLVARLARRHVTVALSGDGGDEFFGGYRKYRLGAQLFQQPGRIGLAALLGALPWDVLERWERQLPTHHRLISPRAASLLHWWNAPTAAQLALRLSEVNRQAARLSITATKADLSAAASPDNPPSYLRTAMLLDSQHYLTDDVLTKVDRATMAVSLESRAPLLNHRVVEFAARLPVAWLEDERGGKRPLRDILYRHVPAALIDRPKQGFSVPLARWLRGELRGWAQDLVQDSPRTADLINLPAARTLLADHLSGRRDQSAALWPLLSLLAWRHHGMST